MRADARRRPPRAQPAHRRPPSRRQVGRHVLDQLRHLARRARRTDRIRSASVGVRFRLSSRSIRAWRTPCADSSPASVARRFFSLPSTRHVDGRLAQIGRDDDAGDRDHADPGILELADRLGDDGPHGLVHSRMRSLTTPTQMTLSSSSGETSSRVAHELPVAGESQRSARRASCSASCAVAGDARDRQRRALPELVMVDLGDRGTEPVLELRLGRLDVLALALERARLREVELDGEDRDVARHGQRLGLGQPRVGRGPGRRGSSSDVRSTSRVS